MKMRGLYLFFVVFLVFSQVVHAQTAPVSQINAAFRSGDVSAIARYMDNVVDVTIANNQSASSRTQAEMMLRDFFAKNDPKGFEAQHSGNNEQNNTVFSIGYLSTPNGRFRVYILLKQQEGNYLLQEIRIEK